MSLLKLPIKGYNPPRQERGRIAEKKLKDALVRLLAKGISYADITNQDILDEANKQSRGKSKLYMQSLYQWFEQRKDTIVPVLAAEYDKELETVIEAFFQDSSHLERDTVRFVRAFTKVSLDFYKAHKEYVLIWHNQSIPSTLRNPSEASRQHLVKFGIDFLQRRGVGQRRYIVAPVVYTVIFLIHELSIQPIFDAQKGFDLFIDTDVEEELEKLLVGYLQPYFDEAKK
jgi:hypothetical protein